MTLRRIPWQVEKLQLEDQHVLTELVKLVSGQTTWQLQKQRKRGLETWRESPEYCFDC